MKNFEFSGGISGGESLPQQAREILGLKEFAATYRETQRLLSWLIECSPNADPTVVAGKRAHLAELLESLGFEPEDPSSLRELENIVSDIKMRIIRPEPTFDVPDVGFFRQRIRELIAEQQLDGTPTPPFLAKSRQTDLSEVARFGHTTWAEVLPRTAESIEASIRGLACVMADPVSYQLRFTSNRLDAPNPADTLEVDQSFDVLNGRHRTLAARCLGGQIVSEMGMSSWIPVMVSPNN